MPSPSRSRASAAKACWLSAIETRISKNAMRYPDVLLSWPNNRAFGRTPAQFLATCHELIADGFYPCPMLCSKDFDPADVPAILAALEPVLPLLIGVVPRVCIGWELSLWLSPTQVQNLIDRLAPMFVAYGCKVRSLPAGVSFLSAA